MYMYLYASLVHESANSGDGAKERKERQTSVQSIEPKPRDWQASAQSTKSLLQTKVCLPFLPFILLEVIG